MSGIYTDFILPLDGTPTSFLHGDHYGISVVKCEYLLNGVVVQPTVGLLSLEWSSDSLQWQNFTGGQKSYPFNYAGASANAVAKHFRMTGTVAGADSVRLYLRLENIGIPGIPQGLISNLRFFDRVRTVNQTLLETATLEGDSYRIYAYFGDKSNLADMGDDFPPIPSNGNVWLSIEYSDTKFTTIANRVLALFSGQGIKYTAYTPGSDFTGAGQPVAVRNLENNLGPTNPADAQVRYLGTTTPPQFTGATEIDFAIVASAGGGTGSSGGGRLPEDQFIVPPIGGQTLVQIYNPSNNAVEVRYEIQITETEI